MWNDDYDFPSVDVPDEDYNLPEHDIEWLTHWEDLTLSRDANERVIEVAERLLSVAFRRT